MKAFLTVGGFARWEKFVGDAAVSSSASKKTPTFFEKNSYVFGKISHVFGKTSHVFWKLCDVFLMKVQSVFEPKSVIKSRTYFIGLLSRGYVVSLWRSVLRRE